MNVAMMAERVADVLCDTGWFQARDDAGRPAIAPGSNCILTASHLAADDYFSEFYTRMEFLSAAAGVIRAEFPDRINGRWRNRCAWLNDTHSSALDRAAVVDFNDHPETTLDDVNLILRKVATR